MKRTLTGVIAATAGAVALLGAATSPALANTSCTYTQGYYKNHLKTFSSVDLAPDVAAAIIAHVPGATSLLDVYNTPPRGDAFLIAADQYVTAALNGAPGSAGFTGAVGTAFYGLTAYFRGTPTTRDQVIAWATTLDNYNNGLLGTPHC